MSFFCHLPWTAVQINNDSCVPCCMYEPIDQTQLTNFEDYLISDELQQFKAQLLNGQAPVQCRACVESEKATGHSFRLLHNRFHDERTQEILANPDSCRIPGDLCIITSNTCNLLCLPCDGTGSYNRGVELHKIELAPRIQKHLRKNSALDNIHKYDFEKITLLGGEPFGDKVTFECLENLIAHGKSKNVTLELTTNGTLIDQQNLDLLSNNFKFVYIKVSLDGVGEVNDYLRYPSDWQDLAPRVLLARNYPNMSLMITTALSNLSLMRFYQLIAWAQEHSIVDVFLSTVSHPQQLAAGNLPESIKQELLKIYTDFKDNNQVSERIEYVLDTCINICQTPNLKDFAHTMTWLKKHDQHRNNSVLTIFPELAQYYEA